MNLDENITNDHELYDAIKDYFKWTEEVLKVDELRSSQISLDDLLYMKAIWDSTDKLFSLVEKHGMENSIQAINFIFEDNNIVFKEVFFNIYLNAVETHRFRNSHGEIVQFFDKKKLAHIINYIITPVISYLNLISTTDKFMAPSLILISFCYAFYFFNSDADKSRYLAPLEEILNEAKRQIDLGSSNLE